MPRGMSSGQESSGSTNCRSALPRPCGGTWSSSSRWFADGFLPWHGCWAAPSSRGPGPALMHHLLYHLHITCRVPATGISCMPCGTAEKKEKHTQSSSPANYFSTSHGSRGGPPVSPLLPDTSVPGPHQDLHPALPSAHLASLFSSPDLDSTACHHHPDLGPGAPSTADPSPAQSRCLPALVLHGQRKTPNRCLLFLNS